MLGAIDATSAITKLLHSGEPLDPLTGLQYVRDRYYDVATGRFTRLDRFFGNLHDPQSLHKYLFTPSDPINFADPSGRSFFAFDGTQNWEGQTNNGQWAPTNVWKMYEASIDPVKHYYRGPGNPVDYGGLSYLLGGMFGYDMSGILDNAWQDLLDARRRGDRTTDIIGFSRGAVMAIEFANRVADRFPDQVIRFVGLFDPVGSVGFPGRFGAYRSTLPSSVQFAANALARNEDRTFFPSTLLSSARQEWFRGTHSDVGGGWADHRLSDTTWEWMTSHAITAGVSIRAPAQVAGQYPWGTLSFNPNTNGPINMNEGLIAALTFVGGIDRVVARGVLPISALPHVNNFIAEAAFSIAVFGVV